MPVKRHTLNMQPIDPRLTTRRSFIQNSTAAVGGFLAAQKDSQLERNGRLEKAITSLDKEIADIKDLKDQISNEIGRASCRERVLASV